MKKREKKTAKIFEVPLCQLVKPFNEMFSGFEP